MVSKVSFISSSNYCDSILCEGEMQNFKQQKITSKVAEASSSALRQLGLDRVTAANVEGTEVFK